MMFRKRVIAIGIKTWIISCVRYDYLNLQTDQVIDDRNVFSKSQSKPFLVLSSAIQVDEKEGDWCFTATFVHMVD